MKAQEKLEYCGWSNWETWNANLYMTNEEHIYLQIVRVSRNNDFTADDIKGIYLLNFPKGTPDMEEDKSNYVDSINFEEISEYLNE